MSLPSSFEHTGNRIHKIYSVLVYKAFLLFSKYFITAYYVNSKVNKMVRFLSDRFTH